MWAILRAGCVKESHYASIAMTLHFPYSHLRRSTAILPCGSNSVIDDSIGEHVMQHEEKVTRKNTSPLKVYCLPDEREAIEVNAKQAGLSVSTYLRRIGQGRQVKSVVDAEQVRELVRVNGDLGRLGGLLKLWLTNDAKAAQIGTPTIRAVLNRIDSTKAQMSELMESILSQRS